MGKYFQIFSFEPVYQMIVVAYWDNLTAQWEQTPIKTI